MELTVNGVKAYTNPVPEARPWGLPENQRLWRVMFTDGGADAYVVTSVAVFGPVAGDEVMAFAATGDGAVAYREGLGQCTSHEGALVAGMRTLLLERHRAARSLVVVDEDEGCQGHESLYGSREDVFCDGSCRRSLEDGDETLGPCGCTDYHLADCDGGGYTGPGDGREWYAGTDDWY